MAAVLEFSHGGEVFRLPAMRAKILDVAALRQLATLVVSDAVVRGSGDLTGSGNRRRG